MVLTLKALPDDPIDTNDLKKSDSYQSTDSRPTFTSSTEALTAQPYISPAGNGFIPSPSEVKLRIKTFEEVAKDSIDREKKIAANNFQEVFSQYERSQIESMERCLGVSKDFDLVSRLNSITQKLCIAAGFKENEIKLFLVQNAKANAFVFRKPTAGENADVVAGKDNIAIHANEDPESKNVIMWAGLIKELATYKANEAEEQLNRSLKLITSSMSEEDKKTYIQRIPVFKEIIKGTGDLNKLHSDLKEFYPQGVADSTFRAISSWDSDRVVTEGNIAYVIAHEIQHIRQKFEATRNKNAVQKIVTQHQEEHDADLTGIREIMGVAGYNPKEAVPVARMFLKLGSSYSSTHPHLASRIKEIEKQLANPDATLPGLEKNKTKLPDMQEFSYRSDDIIERITGCDSLEELYKNLSEGIINVEDLLVREEMASQATKIAHARAFSKDPRNTSLFGRMLSDLGDKILREINSYEKKLETSKKDVEKYTIRVNEAENEGVKAREEAALQNAQGFVKMYEEEIEFLKQGNPRFHINTESFKPDQSKLLKAWEKIGIPGASVSDKQQDEALESISRRIYCLNQLTDEQWNALTKEWIEKGESSHFEGKINLSTIMIKCQLESRSDKHYDLETKVGRQKFAEDCIFLLYVSDFLRYPKCENIFLKDQAFERAREIVTTLTSEEKIEKISEVSVMLAFGSQKKLFFRNEELSSEDATIAVYAAAKLFHDSKNGIEGSLKDYCAEMNVDAHILRFINYCISTIDSIEPGDIKSEHLLQEAVSELTHRFPLESQEIFELYSVVSDPLKMVDNCPQHAPLYMRSLSLICEYWDKIALNYTQEELAHYRYLFCDRIPLNINFQEHAFGKIDFLAHSFGIKSFDKSSKTFTEQQSLALITELSRVGLALNTALSRVGIEMPILPELIQEIKKRTPEASQQFNIFCDILGYKINSDCYGIGNEEKLSLLRVVEDNSLPADVLLEMLPKFGWIPRREEVGELLEQGLVSKEGLSKFLIVLGECASDVNSISKAELSKIKNLQEVFQLYQWSLEQSDFKEHTRSRLIGREHLSMDSLDREDNLVEYLVNKLDSVEEISNALSPGNLRDEVLLGFSQNRNNSIEILEKIIPYLTQHEIRSVFPSSTEEMVARFVLYEEGIDGEYGEGTRERLRTRSQEYVFPDVSVVHIADNTNEKLSALQLLYPQKPEYFLPEGMSFDDSVLHVTTLVPVSDFRDNLLQIIFEREIFSINKMPHQIVRKSHVEMLDDTFRPTLELYCSLVLHEERSPLSKKMIDTIDSSRLMSLIENVLPFVNSVSTRERLGGMIIDNTPASDAKEAMEVVIKYLPEPSPLRDGHIKRIAMQFSITQEDSRYLRSFLTNECLRTGVSEPSRFFGSQIMRGELEKSSKSETIEWLNWFLRTTDSPPRKLQTAGGALGVSFESIRDSFLNLTQSERRDFFFEVLLTEDGLFKSSTLEDMQMMREFLGGIYDSHVGGDTNLDPRYRKIFLSVFEFSPPVRRHEIFSSVINQLISQKNDDTRILTPDQKFYKFLGTFLDNSGPAGRKIAQILSEYDQIPEDLRIELKTLKSSSEPFSTLGVWQRAEDEGFTAGDIRILSIGELKGAASMKQAHEVETNVGEAIFKALRPSIDKHIKEDVMTLYLLSECLIELGFSVPAHLVREIEEILAQESDLRIEAQNHLRIEQEIAGRRSLGFNLAVPKILNASKTAMLETKAMGIPLEELEKSQVPSERALAERISSAIGLEVMRQIWNGKVFHADLHSGNIFYDKGTNTITFIDCGAAGNSRKELKDLAVAIFRKDAKKICSIMRTLQGEYEPLSQAAFEDLKQRVQALCSWKLKSHDIVKAIGQEILEVMNPHPDLRMFMKALTVALPHLKKSFKLDWNVDTARRFGQFGKTLSDNIFGHSYT